jgi:hypothetical protein
MQVVGEDGLLNIGTQLDGKVRGAVKTFNVLPGSTATLSMEVLNGDALFAVQLKRLEKSGQLNDVGNFISWMEDNLPSNSWTLQEVLNPPYFTKDNENDGGLPADQAGVFSFDLFVDATTPADVYDLEFSVGGRTSADEPFYQDEHFYLNVIPEPGTFALLALGLGGLAARGRRRLR